MIRTTLDKAYIKRPLRPRYGWTQTTPQSFSLSSSYDRTTDPDIYPGCVAYQDGAGTVNLATANTDAPIIGLFGHFVVTDGDPAIDEITDQGIDAIAVWVLGPDAEFEVDSEAFNGTSNFAAASPGDLLYHDSNGKLALDAQSAGASQLPVARFVEALSTTTIVIGGLLAGMDTVST